MQYWCISVGDFHIWQIPTLINLLAEMLTSMTWQRKRTSARTPFLQVRSTAIMTELIFLKSLVVRFLDLLKTSQFNLCPCILSGSVLAEEKHCMNEVRVSRDGGLWWG